MRSQSKAATGALFCSLAICALWAQDRAAERTRPVQKTKSPALNTQRTLNPDDRLAVIASALDSKRHRSAEHDCSHLVHSIYERAGFPYAYASSDDLYDGVEKFQRVSHPQPADLVVWRGHVGIVIRPSRHIFFSFLHAGPGTDDYSSRYWTSRGEPHFYRYIKN